MSVLDGPMRAVASSLISTFGKEVVAVVVRPASYDPSTRRASENATEQTVRGVLGRWRQHELSGDIRATDLKLMVAAAEFTDPPTTDWRVRVDGIEHEAVECMATYSGDQVAVYTMALRS